MSLIPFSATELILGAVLASIAIFGNFIALMMIDKIDERVAEPERISYIWWSARLLHRYRQLYPNGRLALIFRACVIAMAVVGVFLAYSILG